jgi:hypothetical protein
MNTRLMLSLVVIVVLLTSVGGATAHVGAPAPAAPQSAVGTGFTFQGQLKNAGAAINGGCTMTFRLYDAAATGAQIGSTITATVPVSNSLFTVMLNASGEYGANAFNGDARWLQVAVKCAGDAAFTALSPRQQITAAPYAQYALAGNNAASSTWIQQSPRNTPPSARYASSNAYDAVNDRLVLFSGVTSGGLPYPTDVWVLANASGIGGTSGWMQLSPAGGPPPSRQGGTAVYDSVTNRFILHGGCGGACSPVLADTWVLSNANGLGGTPGWTQLPSAPVARANHTAVYDSGSNRMIVFGGIQAFAGTDRNDVWVLIDANGIGSPTWVQLSPTGTPPDPRSSSSAIYDPATNRMIIFGGAQFVSPSPYTFIYYNDVWALTNANGLGGTPQWIQLNPTGTLPAARSGSSLTYDPITNRMTLVGGQFQTNGVSPVATFYSDVWVLTGANGVGGSLEWIQLTPNGGSPLGRLGHAFGYAPSSNRLIAATGDLVGSVLTNEVWLLTNANGLIR